MRGSRGSFSFFLVTTEAVELYFKKLSANGIVAFHITNWFLNLDYSDILSVMRW